MQKSLILLFFLFSNNLIFSQVNITRFDSIKVKVNGNFLRNPWAGGLNAPQFSAFDLNLDNKKDLLVFDRTGSRVRTFINEGDSGEIKYSYKPEYEEKFPTDLLYFVLAVDYNCDGKEDLFTYSSGGMAVYKNTSDAGGLNFQKVTSLVMSTYQGGLNLNLYISSGNLPAIEDIDNDGDLDVLTFDIGGVEVEFHKNMSKELYGNCDSLKFAETPGCWGKFKGTSVYNDVDLHAANCRIISTGNTKHAHSGSTILALDINNDGAKEALIGCVCANTLLFLTNGGTSAEADMIAQTTNFPSNSVIVDLPTFPAAFYLDINNDGKRDLIVAPNLDNVSENAKGIWLYLNTGTEQNPIFTFEKNNFLQDEMIETGEGNYPVFFDYNLDGLKDLIVGNYGFYKSGTYESRLLLYKNVGTTTTPEFELIDDNYLDVKSLILTAIYPAFGDLDHDGDKDLLLGESNGFLIYYENTAGAGNPATFVLTSTSYKNIDALQFSAPQIVDVNRDGKNDLLVGTRNGNVKYYENIGTLSNPNFDVAGRILGGVDVRTRGYTTGYCIPFMFNNNGNTELLAGSENGHIYYYTNIDNNLNGTFDRTDTTLGDINIRSRLSVSGADINDDGKLDLAIGHYNGGTTIYLTNLTHSAPIVGISNPGKQFFGVYPNPASNYLTVEVNDTPKTAIGIEIYNLLGEKIFELKTSDNLSKISLKNWRPGFYICQIRSENFPTRQEKFLILK